MLNAKQIDQESLITRDTCYEIYIASVLYTKE